MAKRKRNTPSEPEIPTGIVAIFFVIAVAVAFAKAETTSVRHFACARLKFAWSRRPI